MATITSLATQGRPAPVLPSPGNGVLPGFNSNKAYQNQVSSKIAAQQTQLVLLYDFCKSRSNPNPTAKLTVKPIPTNAMLPKATRVRRRFVSSMKASFCKPRSQVHAVCASPLLQLAPEFSCSSARRNFHQIVNSSIT